ncbi:helix-turn-helix domain-containing protein [Corynebacterium variabile]|uniref:ROK family transcriptional regulator n=1 Tax=Corynebacterium variabile TaxID=1727 RepID=UPI003A929325
MTLTVADAPATETTPGTAHFATPVTGPARVLHQIRTTPGITRTRLHEDLGLSQPTVTRHVAALIDAGLVEQASPSQSSATTVGRPGTTLLPTGRHHTALGAHVGLRSTQLVAVDGSGRPLRSRTLKLPLADLSPEDALEAVSHGLTSLGRDLPDPVSLGVAFSSPVDAAGRVSSQAYGWDDVDVAGILGRADTGIPVSLATGVGAMAGAELTSTPLRSADNDIPGGRSTLYVYARELVAHSWIVGDAVHQPFTGTSPTAFTTIAESGSFRSSRGGTGHPLGTTAVLDAARRKGLGVSSVPELVAVASSNAVARALLDERAELLGRIITLAVEVVDPATVVFAGDAFTADPDAVKIIAGGLQRSAPRRGLSIQRAGDGILSRAAAVTALHRLWTDPLG